MTILVTGAAGQLGRAIVEEFRRGNEVVALTRRQLDLTNHKAILDTIGRERPAVVINCAAYNDVDGAEEASVEALAVNMFALRSLARAATETGAILVHYGTDFVFDGTSLAPYAETDRPNPKSVYAASKLLGEWFACEAPRHYVLRVESLFGPPNAPKRVRAGRARSGSVDKIVDAIAQDREARVFVDRTVSPSYVVDVAAATRALIERAAPWGLYHSVNSGSCTWYELAQEVARQIGRQPRIRPVMMADLPLRASRPKFCALANAKLASVGIEMPPWQDALARYLAARAPAKRARGR